MADELLPCPWHPEVIYEDDRDDYKPSIAQRMEDGKYEGICGYCGCCSNVANTSEEAAKIWNTRADADKDAQIASLEEKIAAYIHNVNWQRTENAEAWRDSSALDVLKMFESWFLDFDWDAAHNCPNEEMQQQIAELKDAMSELGCKLASANARAERINQLAIEICKTAGDPEYKLAMQIQKEATK